MSGDRSHLPWVGGESTEASRRAERAHEDDRCDPRTCPCCARERADEEWHKGRREDP